jgi:hypothetical protein
MKPGSILFTVALCVLGVVGCQALSYRPPAVTAEVVRAGAGMRVDEQTLREGRRLFVSRCIECHTPPIVWYYAESDWPGIVHRMAGRASLKPAEQKAIVAYILAVRAPTK